MSTVRRALKVFNGSALLSSISSSSCASGSDVAANGTRLLFPAASSLLLYSSEPAYLPMASADESEAGVSGADFDSSDYSLALASTSPREPIWDKAYMNKADRILPGGGGFSSSRHHRNEDEMDEKKRRLARALLEAALLKPDEEEEEELEVKLEDQKSLCWDHRGAQCCKIFVNEFHGREKSCGCFAEDKYNNT